MNIDIIYKTYWSRKNWTMIVWRPLDSWISMNQHDSLKILLQAEVLTLVIFSIVALSAAAEWLLSGWSWQNIVCLYVWTIKKVYQERLMNANTHRFGSCSLSLSLTPAANMMSSVGSGSGVQVIDSPLLTQQIEAQRLCIKHLKNENNRLKVQVSSKPPQCLSS